MKNQHLCRSFILATAAFILFVLAFAQSAAAGKIKIEKLDDLPRHTYTIQVKAVALFEDDEALKQLISDFKKDLLSDLDTYEINDKTTLKDYYQKLGIVALLEENYDDYLDYLQKRNDLEDKEPLKLTRGLFAKAYIAALKAEPDDFRAALKSEYEKRVNALPYEVVADELKTTKGQTDIISKNLMVGMINERIQPILDGSHGEMSKDIAASLISFNYTVRYYLPYKDIVGEVLSAYLDAHQVKKPDIWQERDISLDPSAEAVPVLIGIWDSGVDVTVFEDQVFVNPGEIPDNSKDDDGNGYVDDVNGIAYDLHGNKTPDLLYPIEDVGTDRKQLQRLMKGLTDLTSNIESEEAIELKRTLGSLEPSQVKPFIEGISAYGNHCHGTHVAGIAVEGNPFARILPARLTFDHHLIPIEPTVELARKDSVMMIETVGYFKEHGVRVVNMSWGNSMDEIESALEANNAGGDAEGRKKLARRIFEIEKAGLYSAIASAPEILFITSAGNSDNDVNFEEFIPSSFDLPNLMSVGAVDQAGEETDFTSFGKVDVYANGFEVESYVPGGDRLKLSGTSMSSPNVTNLAAKLFALRPDLTPSQVRSLIEEGCDESRAGERPVRLINPKNSLNLLAQMK